MSSSDSSHEVRIMDGDLLESGAQTLVNTVNTVGVMGKGVALAFKRRYPDMFRDYVRRCDGGQVQLRLSRVAILLPQPFATMASNWVVE